MIRSPELGKVKTRLAADVGDETALKLYLAFIEDSLEMLEELNIDVILSVYSNDNNRQIMDHIHKDHKIIDQKGKNLGERQYKSLEEAFKLGYEKVVVMAADCPDLEPDFIEGAFASLNHCDAVIGPCEDGGYYLLGINREKLDQGIFSDVEWGSDQVMEIIRSNANHLGLVLFELPLWYDIDTYDDLIVMSNRLEGSSKARNTMQIVPLARKSEDLPLE
jgi:hypothetical protein